jgi:nitrite reductase/ring-hydroxylating ferredoxin subunit
VIELSGADAIADGEARLFSRGDGKERVSLVLVRFGDEFRAYANVCPHFGVSLDVGQGIKTFRRHVMCVNHYAVFRFEDGACVEGPCLGATLDAIPTVVRHGRVGIEDPTYAGVKPS